MHRNKSVDVHQFSMVPRADIPRSSFRMQKTYKTTLSVSYLNPLFCEEVLPGDTFNVHATMFARLATPIFPIMDNLHMESFFFFVPNRLVWTHWVNFMGEQNAPADSISYTIPQIVSPNGGYPIGSVFDYFGLPTVGQVGGGVNVSHSALPLRAYALIYNQWFRDENLQNPFTVHNGDGPDPSADYNLIFRGKRHDYFTSCLPWTQKGGVAVTIPLGTSAPVKTATTQQVPPFAGQAGMFMRFTGAGGGTPTTLKPYTVSGSTPASGNMSTSAAVGAVDGGFLYPDNLFADLSAATAATINQLRQSFQIQRLLERDARGGTRYTELVRSHFGVTSPDARLQRPEYLGGGSTPVNVSAIAQTSATGLTGGTSPVGTLSAFGTVTAQGHGFSQSFTEHGYVIGLVAIRADLTYQQGMRRHWSRSTRYDFYFPVFAMLGEQAVLNKEIFVVGSASGGLGAADQDMQVFGYQERWAEYRYNPSEITGLFRSTAAGTLDAWHLAQKFAALPVLNAQFIQDDATGPLSRVSAVPSQPNFIFDSFWDIKLARPMPMYSVPGMIDHF